MSFNPRQPLSRRRSDRSRGIPLALPLALAAALAGGCATFQAPKWPWAKDDPAAAAQESAVARELGDDADSEVISSEITGASQDYVFD